MVGWTWLRIGAVLGCLSVAFGAFGAHKLRDALKIVESDSFEIRAQKQRAIENLETAARYQMYHALALVAVGLLAGQAKPGGILAVAGWSFLIGTLLFSGSLYGWVLTGQRWLVALTPIGGVFFLAGWLALAMAAGRMARPAAGL